MTSPYYQDTAVTIYHGDCREILPLLRKQEEIDAVIGDPPYGINHRTGRGASWMNTQIEGDYSVELRDWVWDQFEDKPRAMFGLSWKARPPKHVRCSLIWDKGPASGMGDLSLPFKSSWEEIYLGGEGWQGKRDEGVLRGPCVVSWETHVSGRSHPHQKPTWIFARLLEKLPAVRLVLDPFMGTGSLLEAVKLLGKRAIGVEIEERYCEIAARRMAQEVFDL